LNVGFSLVAIISSIAILMPVAIGMAKIAPKTPPNFKPIKRDKIIFAITLWCLIALLISRNIQLLDTVSVLISLGIPFAILVGAAIKYLK